MQAEIIYKGSKLKVLKVASASKSDDPNVTTAYICETEDGSSITILNTEAEGVIDGQSDSQDSGQQGQFSDKPE